MKSPSLKPWTAWIDSRGQEIRLTEALISRSQSPCVCTHAPTNFSLCFQYVSNTKALQFCPNDGSPMVRIMPLQPVPVHLCRSWVRVLTCRRANVHMNLHGSKLCKPYIKVSSIEQHDQLHDQSSVNIALRYIRGKTILGWQRNIRCDKNNWSMNVSNSIVRNLFRWLAIAELNWSLEQ